LIAATCCDGACCSVDNQMEHIMARVDTQNMVVAHGRIIAHIPKKMI